MVRGQLREIKIPAMNNILGRKRMQILRCMLDHLLSSVDLCPRRPYADPCWSGGVFLCVLSPCGPVWPILQPPGVLTRPVLLPDPASVALSPSVGSTSYPSPLWSADRPSPGVDHRGGPGLHPTCTSYTPPLGEALAFPLLCGCAVGIENSIF